LIRIGTRGSALAVAQAEWVAARLPDECELVRIANTGTEPNDKSRWTSALERALLEDEIDVAVHSAKDVPTELAPGLELVAFPKRVDPRDVICGADSLASLPAGSRVGTSSLRRAAQLRALRDDLQVVELRGNVDTRLRKLEEGAADALVLARAGLERLDRTRAAGAVLDPETFVPAPGQGALALEARADDEATRLAVEGLNDPEAAACLAAERALAAELGGSCHTPIGGHATPASEGDRLRLRAFVGLPDGSAWVRDAVEGKAPDALGREVAERVLSAGARDLLAAAEAAAGT
jgi:hydroxymethylbilane synthase